MTLGRRAWLAGAGALLAAEPALGLSGAGTCEHPRTPSMGSPARLLVVLLRGGADGLGLAPPLRSPLASERPTLWRPPHALTEEIGLAAPLAPWLAEWERGVLTVVPGVGSVALPRGHHRARLRLLRWLDAAARARGHASLPRRSAPESFGLALERISREWARDQGPRLAVVEQGDWDLHVAAAARTEGVAGELAHGLARFWAATREVPVTTLVVSEHGRSVLENELSGTDDGGAGVAFVHRGPFAGGVRGGWGHLRWEGAAVTTDVRDLLGQVVPEAPRFLPPEAP